MKFSKEYVAGVIDARGHLAINKRHHSLQPRIAVTTRHVDLLEYLAKITGTSVSLDDRGYTRRPCSEHCELPHSEHVRQSARWRVDSGRAVVVLFNIRPHMHAQRGRATELITIGMKNWPPERGDTLKQMQKLGWEIP